MVSRRKAKAKAKTTNIWSDDESESEGEASPERKARGATSDPPPKPPGANEDDERKGGFLGERSSGSESESDVAQSQDAAAFDISKPPEENTLRVLIATDNHLGYLENDAVRGNDSFVTMEEILQKAIKYHADIMVLGGDLFHHNKPSRTTLHKTMLLFRKYCLGGGAVAVEILSDQKVNFPSAMNKAVNYEDPNLAVQLPVFAIHGNHDDPTRDGASKPLSAMDLLQDAGLVNYFGALQEVENAVVSPVLIGKGTARLALYGLGWVNDERLNRMFASHKIKFEQMVQETNAPGWFNMFMVHQNREGRGRGRKNSVAESSIPSFMDLVCFGHEHECRIEFEESITESFAMTQIGSSVATSLVQGEETQKQVLLLEISSPIPGNSAFRYKTIPLQTVRPFIMEEIRLAGVDELDAEAPQAEKIEQVQEYLARTVSNLIEQARSDYKRANPQLSETQIKQTLPLIRLRVEYTGFAPINMQRFGARFTDKVANPGELLSFWKKREVTKRKKRGKSGEEDGELEAEAGDQDEESASDKISSMITEILDQSDKKLSLFEDIGLNQALDDFVNKQESSSIREFVAGAVDDMKRTLKKEKAKFAEKDLSEKSVEEHVRNIAETKQKQAVVAEEAKKVAQETRTKNRHEDTDNETEMRPPAKRSQNKMKTKAPANKSSEPMMIISESESDHEAPAPVSRPNRRAKKAARVPKPTVDAENIEDNGSESEYKADSVEEISDGSEEPTPQPKSKRKPGSAKQSRKRAQKPAAIFTNTQRSAARKRGRQSSGVQAKKSAPRSSTRRARKVRVTEDSDSEESLEASVVNTSHRPKRRKR